MGGHFGSKKRATGKVLKGRLAKGRRALRKASFSWEDHVREGGRTRRRILRKRIRC